jgi:hypothetical protein
VMSQTDVFENLAASIFQSCSRRMDHTDKDGCNLYLLTVLFLMFQRTIVPPSSGLTDTIPRNNPEDGGTKILCIVRNCSSYSSGELVAPCVTLTIQLLCDFHMSVGCVPKMIHIQWNPVKWNYFAYGHQFSSFSLQGWIKPKCVHQVTTHHETCCNVLQCNFTW